MKGSGRLVAAIIGIAVAIAVSPIATSAQSYPARPVRILLGAPPGSGPDIVGRILAEKMAGVLGQPVIVENRPQRERSPRSWPLKRAPTVTPCCSALPQIWRSRHICFRARVTIP